MREELGKIQNVVVGRRCADSPFGVSFTLSGPGWGVVAGLERFGVEYTFKGLEELCEMAKVMDVYSLKNIPIRAHFNSDRAIAKVEILEEVL